MPDSRAGARGCSGACGGGRGGRERVRVHVQILSSYLLPSTTFSPSPSSGRSIMPAPHWLLEP